MIGVCTPAGASNLGDHAGNDFIECTMLIEDEMFGFSIPMNSHQ
ncbi:hypothetical protein [Nocardia nova]